MTRYVRHCVDAFRDREIQTSEDPMFLLASLIGLLRLALWYWDVDVDAKGLVYDCCLRVGTLMADTPNDTFRDELCSRISSEPSYRE